MLTSVIYRMRELIKTGILGVVLACISLIAAYALWAFFQGPNNVNPESEMTICTADAMQCPDGTYVGRTGPNCHFVCPVKIDTPTTNETKINGKLGVAAQGEGIKIIPLSLIADSRCPVDVECIWAGTVTIKVLVESGLGASTQEISIGESITTEAETITFTSVSPSPNSTRAITSSEYVFTFTVTKRN